MPWLLSYAESADNSGSGLALVLFAMLAIVVAGGLAFVPMALVWSRRRRAPEAVLGFAALWGIVVFVVALSAAMRQQAWSREYAMRVSSGYFDPDDTSDKPQPPWALWGGCAAAYAALLGWSATGKPRATLASGNSSAADTSDGDGK